MTTEHDAVRLNTAITKALVGMKPPEDLTVTEWAEEKRRLSSESSAEPGPWRTSRTPYLREPMNAFTDPRVRRIVMVAASQVGKSEFLNNAIGYIIDEDPGSILFVHPTTIDAKEYSKLRIAPMIRDCPTLKRKVAPAKSRESGNTLLQKTYPGGILTMCGSTEAHALASKPIRYVFGDERDRWASSAGNEGDPWELAMARQITFYNAKAVEVSTPTVKNVSAIEASYYEGTMERWKSKCPHCGEYHEIKWESIRYEHEMVEVNGKKTYTITQIWYICPDCGCVSDELTMKRQPARWVAENPTAYDHGVRSFWLNAFVSQWASWESIILKYLNAIGDTRKLQVVYNTCFGELWEDRGDLEDEDSLMARREEYTAELPDGVLVLTAGVDTQDNRMEYEILGHGHFGETWGIEKGIVMGRPDDDATWTKLDEMVFNRVFRFADGVGLHVSMSFVDEGGHFTQDVRLQCRSRIGKKVFCIKGMSGPDRPFTAPPKKQKIVVRQRAIGTCWQYQLGVDAGKQIIMDNLGVQTKGPKYCHFPRRDDYGPAYFTGLLSEHLVYKADRRQPWVWEKIPGHERNEALDCRNYALAAFKALPADLDEVGRRLKAARGERPTEGVATPVAAKSARPSKRQKAGDVLRKYYDDW
ncbi:phage terminase large subunit family protein [Anaeromassilibacillus senegalensis]|uniref:phage terminase large subunit family protein n=1 Tax=Anaeromassilibacillus senegalensis TaxID=1673717 RepID=UPI0006832DEB|nr:terminase gpA endonuclease subunit [Anaeromassilibacillus senegalensis]